MAKKKIKKYKVSPDESLCLAVSVVDKPAVESEFVYLSEQKQENFVAVEKKERRMIYGCALRADFPIYRNNGEDEYYIEFDAQSIDAISKNFMKNGFQSNWTAGHQSEVEGLTVTEIWLKEDMYKDKSVALNLDPSIPVGSLFMGCYCENDEIWNAVKEGKYHGFSVEALVGLEEFEKQFKEDVDVETSEATKITPKEDEVKLEEKTPTVEEPKEATVEPQEEPKVEEPTPTKEEPKEEPVEPKNEPKEEPKNDNGHLEELVNNLKAEIEALKELNQGMADKIKDLSKQPSTKPVNPKSKPSAADTYSAWREQMQKYL